MFTIDGIGTVFYDWRRNENNHVEATRWFTIFFFPIVPLGRYQIKVFCNNNEQYNFTNALKAFVGIGKGYETRLSIENPVDLELFPVFRIYIYGFIIVTLITLVIPIGIIIAIIITGIKSGLFAKEITMHPGVMATIGISLLVWISCILAWFLDRSVGRYHIDYYTEKFE